MIERGAILESVLKEIVLPESMTNEQVQEILYFALLNPETVTYITEMEGNSLLSFYKKGALITDPTGQLCGLSGKIKGGIIMAIYHFSVKIIKRSEGRLMVYK